MYQLFIIYYKMNKWYEMIVYTGKGKNMDLAIRYIQSETIDDASDIARQFIPIEQHWQHILNEVQYLPSLTSKDLLNEYLNQSIDKLSDAINVNPNEHQHNILMAMEFIDKAIDETKSKDISLSLYKVSFNTNSQFRSEIVVLSDTPSNAITCVERFTKKKQIIFKNDTIQVQLLNNSGSMTYL